MTLITINGIPAHELRVDIPRVGTWHAQVRLDDLDSALTRVLIAVADSPLELRGIVVEDRVDHSERVIDVVGGVGGWSTVLPPTSYANDAGVTAALVAADLARMTGETIARFEPMAAVLGAAYVRDRRTAWATLLEVAGDGVDCWVELDGTTVCGERDAQVRRVNVLTYQPGMQCVIVDDLDVQVGDTVTSDLLPGPLEVQRLVLLAGTGASPQYECYCSESTDIASQLEGIVERVQHRVLSVLCEYRVTRQVGDRLSLQPVHVEDGLPDLQRVEVWGAVPGVRPTVLPGARALVGFIAGSRARPVVVAFGPASDAQFSPTALTLTGNVTITGALAAASVTSKGEVTATNAASLPVTLTKHKHVVSGGSTAPPTTPEV